PARWPRVRGTRGADPRGGACHATAVGPAPARPLIGSAGRAAGSRGGRAGGAGVDRAALPAERLRHELVSEATGGLWTSVSVVAETGSTNTDLARAAREGAGEGTVLVAEHQRAGRGRVDRSWQSPPRAGLTVSVLLRPGEAGG